MARTDAAARRAYHRAYYEAHREYFAAKARRWAAANSEAYRCAINKGQRRYYRRRKLRLIREAMKP